jgi:hypothetical protein
MVNMQTDLRTYDLRPERAGVVPTVARSDVDGPREQAIQVALVVFAWIVVPAVFWGALALWLVGP